MNDIVFKDLQPNPGRSFACAICTGLSFFKANNEYRDKRVAKNSVTIKWSMSSPLLVKINFHGFVVHNSVAAGFITRNDKGHPCSCWSSKFRE